MSQTGVPNGGFKTGVLHLLPKLLSGGEVSWPLYKTCQPCLINTGIIHSRVHTSDYYLT